MRAILFLALLTFSDYSYADALLEAMAESWRATESEEVYEEYLPEGEPEAYSWDNLYLEPYENLEVIYDPYREDC
jgi:hypothetical protein